MPYFPLGSCDYASLLLGAYLSDNSFGLFDLVGGESVEDEQNLHCWLERSGTIIDITADQFPDGPAKVIVGRETRWHRQYVNRIRETGDFRLNGRAPSELTQTLYARLVNKMRRPSESP